ncbi:reverse transcriptase family protein [Glutamicibacter arilaitensis]|uniref:reverse transcriptase family protein n=1 Tax=Glutamicibacter arilaitensis TaxID=256701 RepID=UPI003FD5BF6F
MLRKANAYNKAIHYSGAYPVLTLHHLSMETGATWGYLRGIIERRIIGYTSIKRMKNDGSFREISAPAPKLMQTQRWILSNILTGLKIHESAFAYRRGISIKHCAEVHLGSRWLLKMDLRNFFGSIEESRVYDVVRGMGYPPLLAFEISRICTVPLPHADVSSGWLHNRGVTAYGSAMRGVLPQGAPTSGALANAIAFRLDTSLSVIAGEYGLEYTRYSDDLTFSSHQKFSRTIALEIMLRVEKAIAFAGFQVHEGKTRIVSPGARKIVLGLMLTPEAVRLLPEFRHQLDNHIRCVELYGPAAHASKRKFDSTLSMINYVDGCLAFALGIEPRWTAKRKDKWNFALERHGHPVNRDK